MQISGELKQQCYEYFNQCYSVKETANHFNLSLDTVHQIIRKFLYVQTRMNCRTNPNSFTNRDFDISEQELENPRFLNENNYSRSIDSELPQPRKLEPEEHLIEIKYRPSKEQKLKLVNKIQFNQKKLNTFLK